NPLIILGTEELKQAESVLKQSFPRVYGCIFNINRGKPHNLEVIADQWPDFTLIICKPKVQVTSHDLKGDFNTYSIYSKSKDSLQNFLNTPGVINKHAFTLLNYSCFNIPKHVHPAQTQILYHCYIFHLFMSFAIFAGFEKKNETTHCTLFYLTNRPTFLNFPCFYYLTFSYIRCFFSYAGLRLALLSPAHAHLVNSTWKYGGDHNSYNSVQNYITHNPSLCVIEEGGTEPVSWLLVYQHAALGLLYTLPQHRREGYAKLLVSVMAENLLDRGHPVYCFVEKENDSFYKLFTSLGLSSINDNKYKYKSP
uniref:Glycine N-acyltransferase-like protein n=1 Tax=Sinocyclocheilus anshuiensis TaxID=1608454 RepID=A0A671QCH4_9TELE